jgi:hypothetical protein
VDSHLLAPTSAPEVDQGGELIKGDLSSPRLGIEEKFEAAIEARLSRGSVRLISEQQNQMDDYALPLPTRTRRMRFAQ